MYRLAIQNCDPHPPPKKKKKKPKPTNTANPNSRILRPETQNHEIEEREMNQK